MSSSSDYVLELRDCRYFRVEGMRLLGPGVIGGNIVYAAPNSDHVQIVGNEITGSVCQGIAMDESSADYQILRNHIHHNGVGGSCDQPAHGIYVQGFRHLIANNVIHDHTDPSGYGIQNYDFSVGVTIVNNTIANSGRGPIVIGGGGGVSGTVVTNNIVTHGQSSWGIRSASTRPTNCQVHHNLGFSNSGGTIDPALDSACSTSANQTADPRYVNYAARDLRVQAGSPAINAGASPFVSPAFDGVARVLGASPDIGAFEK
jgi:hypothetical protein